MPFGCCRGNNVLAGCQAVGSKFAVGIRGDSLRFGAGDGDGDVCQACGIVATVQLGPHGLDATEDGTARWSFRKGFDPLNVGVLSRTGYLVSAAATIGAQVAIGRGVTVDQVIVPLHEAVTTGGALIGCVNDGLPAWSAAIGCGHVEMNNVLARPRRGLPRRLVIRLLDLDPMAHGEGRGGPVGGTDRPRLGTTASHGRVCAEKSDYCECGCLRGGLVHQLSLSRMRGLPCSLL